LLILFMWVVYTSLLMHTNRKVECIFSRWCYLAEKLSWQFPLVNDSFLAVSKLGCPSSKLAWNIWTERRAYSDARGRSPRAW
jgi:hypothetical protein